MATLYPIPDVISPVGPRTPPARAERAADRAPAPAAQAETAARPAAPPAASGRGRQVDVAA
jgi:hypothetical protein